MVSSNALAVYNYVKANDGKKFTASDIGEATGLSTKSVDGIVTMKFQKVGLMKRTPAEVELADGTHKSVKFISLTEAGRSWDPSAEAAD